MNSTGMITRAVQAMKQKAQPSSAPAPRKSNTLVQRAANMVAAAKPEPVTTEPTAPRRPTGQFVSPKKHPATRHY